LEPRPAEITRAVANGLLLPQGSMWSYG
jgi:hypothetical protein